MNIHILTVPNEEIKERRGFTGADWWYDETGDLQIRIACMSSWDREMCLAIHECVEAILWRKRHGTDVTPIDEFDEIIEEATPEKHGIDAGDQPGCPYLTEHSAATACERIAATLLDIGSWKEYDDELSAL